jgi:hypothetical protein
MGRQVIHNGMIYEDLGNGQARVIGPANQPPMNPEYPYKGPKAAADVSNTTANTTRTAVQTRGDLIDNRVKDATAPAMITKAEADARAAEAQAAIRQRELETTPAQKSADEAFASEYAKWSAGGGFSGVENQLESLEAQIPRLESSDTISGPIMGRLWDPIRQAINPDSISTQQNVERNIQATLRETLGAQFTEKEAEGLLRRSYDPRLDERENIERLRGMISELRSRANTKNDSAGYFERNGTIRGWTPPPRKAPTSDYAREMAKQREAFLSRHKGRPDAAEIWRKVAEPAGRASLERRLKVRAPRKKSSARFLGWED